MKKYLVYLVFSMLLAACSQGNGSKEESVSAPIGLTGVYKSMSGKDTLVFSADGKVISKHPLNSRDLVTTYSFQAGKVSYQFADGYPTTLSVNKDGSLTSNFGTQYVKND